MKRLAWLLQVALLVIPSSALAISAQDRHSVIYDTVFYDPEATGSLTCGAGSATLDGHTLPATKGGAGYEQYFDNPEAYALIPPPASQKEIDYYITMRWRYRNWAWDGTNTEGPEEAAFYQGHPRVLVTNPRSGKSIIAVALEAGPAPWAGTEFDSDNPPPYWQGNIDGTPPEYQGRVAGFPPKATQALGLAQRMADGSGDDLIYAWAPDQKAEPGPTSIKAAQSDAVGCSGEANFIKHVSFNGAAITPTAVVLHWTGGSPNAGVEELLIGIKSNTSCGSGGCSVQLFADGKGKLFQLTDPLNSYTEHATGINDKAIGIEIAGRDEEDLLNNQDQFQSVVAAVVYLLQRYNINVEGNVEDKTGVLGHFQTDQASYGGHSGKQDPGAEYLTKVQDAVRSALGR